MGNEICCSSEITWWHGENVRECQCSPEFCSWNSDCRGYQQTGVQWPLKSSCWKWAPKPQGSRIFCKMRVRFPQQTLARGSECIPPKPTCTCLRSSPWCQQEFPACGEELNITVKICHADLREEFLSLSVENVMIYLIVRKKDRNSMKIFKRKHTHTTHNPSSLWSQRLWNKKQPLYQPRETYFVNILGVVFKTELAKFGHQRLEYYWKERYYLCVSGYYQLF